MIFVFILVDHPQVLDIQSSVCQRVHCDTACGPWYHDFDNLCFFFLQELLSRPWKLQDFCTMLVQYHYVHQREKITALIIRGVTALIMAAMAQATFHSLCSSYKSTYSSQTMYFYVRPADKSFTRARGGSVAVWNFLWNRWNRPWFHVGVSLHIS